MYGRWGSNTRLIFPGSRIDAAAPKPNLALPQCIGQQSLQIVDFAAPPWPGFLHAQTSPSRLWAGRSIYINRLADEGIVVRQIFRALAV